MQTAYLLNLVIAEVLRLRTKQKIKGLLWGNIDEFVFLFFYGVLVLRLASER